MASSDRRRAPASGEASARASALAQLQNLRQQGGRRLDAFQLKLEDKIYDSLPEADYNLLVAKRRQSDKGFVVGDSSLGYEDAGEEEDWEVDVRPESSDEEEIAGGKTRKTKPKASVSRKDAPNKKTTAVPSTAALLGRQRVSSMFAAASGAAALKRTPSTIKADPSADSILEDVLADITVDDTDRERERQRRRGGVSSRRISYGASPSVESPVQPMHTVTCQKETSNLSSMETENFTVSNIVPDSSDCERTGNDVDVFHELKDEKAEALSQEESATPLIGDDCTMQVCKSDVKDAGIAITKVSACERRAGLNAKVTDGPSENKVVIPWRATMETASETTVKEEDTDNGFVSLDTDAVPLDSDGRLDFFLIDAYEEAFGANPGTIFLFGKVKKGNKYNSCCLLVRNMQRCVYAVPHPDVFPAHLLEEYEQESKLSNSGARVEFMKRLQDLSKDLKAELAQRLMDMDVNSFRMAPVKRSYAFENTNVPAGEHYYVKLSYPFKDAPLPADAKGKHFGCLLGTHTSALELFLIKSKIKGPMWLSIERPTMISSSSQVSWCKMEFSVDSPKQVTVPPPGKAPQKLPPILVASLNLKTVINHKNNVNEIASASVVCCLRVKVDMPMPQNEWNTKDMINCFSIVRKLDGGIFPVGFSSDVTHRNSKAGANVLSIEGSERALLSHLINKLHQLDADALVGHNISGFDLDILLHRLQACKVQSNVWSKIGRLKRSSMPKLSGGGNMFGGGASQGVLTCLAGRLICDTYLASRDLLKEVSYGLTQLSKSQLGMDRRELSSTDIPNMYQSSTSLMEMIECGEADAWLSLALMFRLSILPLTRQLTNISGNLWNKTLQGARAQRVEYLLLHEFHARKFIVPDKLSLREKENLAHKRKASKVIENVEEDVDNEEPRDQTGKKKKGPAYMGGLVLEPKKGLYDKFVLLLDFNSLYPSIIQEYNLCFTTVKRSTDGSIPTIPSTDVSGVLPQVLKNLVERRRQVKKWLKQTSDQLKYQQLDIQQQALKLTANSMYGCLGFVNSRFYAKQLAELITSQGRDILQNTVDLVQGGLNLEVIYGDTDSIMIHTGLEDLHMVRPIAAKVIKEVNKKYRLLEIDLDGIFKRMLLLKKKKYAAVKIKANDDGTYQEIIEQKGLDIVRRDWSLISKEIGNFCLEQILSGGTCEDVVEAIHICLRKLQEEMRSGEVDLDKYVITKSLTKDPESYPDAKNQPHVQVALRLRQAGHRVGCSIGDTVPYIICYEQGSNPSTLSIAERARHPDELKQSPGDWMVDIDYYLSQQIHPVVLRLCAPIEGTDAKHLAECLGLDSSKFQTKSSTSVLHRDEAMVSASVIIDDDDRYQHCDPLHLICPSCSIKYEFCGLRHFLSSMKDSGDGSGENENPQDHASKNQLAEDHLQCPKCRLSDASQKLSAAMLANQVKLRTEGYIGRYYEAWMECDDELCGQLTKNINLRLVGDAERGTVCPNYPRCNGRLVRQYTEVDLYKQLTHFCRMFDVDLALEKIPEAGARLAAEKKLMGFRRFVNSASHIVQNIRDRCSYRWVHMESLGVTLT